MYKYRNGENGILQGHLWNIIQETCIFIIIAWFIIAVALRTHRHYRKYLTVSAVIYILVLLYVTLLGRTVKSESQMELSFLWEYQLALSGNTGWWIQIFDNIMLFVPMGWLFGTLKSNTNFKGSALFGLCVSLFIDLSQLVFKLGLFEFDDILNNTIGMMVGYGLYRLLERKCRCST